MIGTRFVKPLEDEEKIKEYAKCAEWCNDESNWAYIADEADCYVVRRRPAKTQEELEAEQLAKLKAERQNAVDTLTVEVDGLVFDGNEEAQERMARTVAIAIASGADINTEKRTWVLADNSVVEVTVAQLAEACKLAGDKQTELWVVPYTV
jgi:hypothetical protein